MTARDPLPAGGAQDPAPSSARWLLELHPLLAPAQPVSCRGPTPTSRSHGPTSQWLPRPRTPHPALGVQVPAPRLGLALRPRGGGGLGTAQRAWGPAPLLNPAVTRVLPFAKGARGPTPHRCSWGLHPLDLPGGCQGSTPCRIAHGLTLQADQAVARAFPRLAGSLVPASLLGLVTNGGPTPRWPCLSVQPDSYGVPALQLHLVAAGAPTAVEDYDPTLCFVQAVYKVLPHQKWGGD